MGEFYDYLVYRWYQNYRFEAAYKEREVFIQKCLSLCRINYSERDVESFAEKIISYYLQEAERSGQSLEKYWEEVRMVSIGVEPDPDPYVFAVNSAKYHLGKPLWVGAMAKKLDIDPDDVAVKEMFGAVGRNIGFNEMVKMRCSYLEEMVIKALAPELQQYSFSLELFSPGSRME